VNFRTAPLQVEYNVAPVQNGKAPYGKSASFRAPDEKKGSKGSDNKLEPPKTGQGNAA